MTKVPENIKKQLLDYPFVTAVGTAQGRGERHKNGEKAAVAFVTEKKEESELDQSDILPKEVDGWKVDVQPVGQIGIEPVEPEKAQDTGEINTTSRHRPSPHGVSAGHRNITAGTDGFVAWEKAEVNGIVYAEPRTVSNNHVYADENNAEEGDLILQPGSYDGGQADKDVVGRLQGFVPIKDKGNKVDVAWASIDGRKMNSYIPSIGVPTETAKVSEGDKVKKFGRTTGLKKGKVISTDARVRVNYDTGLKEFKDQIIIESISAGGDSGSAVVNSNGELVGLLFAGSDKVTIANSIENVLNQTGLYLNPSNVYGGDSQK